MKTKQTTARTYVPLGPARSLTKASGGISKTEANPLLRYD